MWSRNNLPFHEHEFHNTVSGRLLVSRGNLYRWSSLWYWFVKPVEENNHLLIRNNFMFSCYALLSKVWLHFFTSFHAFISCRNLQPRRRSWYTWTLPELYLRPVLWWDGIGGTGRSLFCRVPVRIWRRSSWSRWRLKWALSKGSLLLRGWENIVFYSLIAWGSWSIDN